jgi:nucleoside-diphosphate-sugar epimerase
LDPEALVNALVITGASSFLGRALLADLPAGAFSAVRILVHRSQPLRPSMDLPVTEVWGDLLQPESLRELVTPGSTVVHLAYLASARPKDDNLAAARNLLGACRNAGIRRMVHCSTAVVVGRASQDVVTEETPSHPATEYEQAKYRIEQEMLNGAAGNHEVTILRPTQVFGPGGKNLVALADRIRAGNVIANYVYSALQGRRNMNLVSVYNVAGALGFLATAQRSADRQTYLISDDRDPLNNFRDVDTLLRREFGCERTAPVAAMPSILLSAALMARGRSNFNSRRLYSDEKLEAAGYAKRRGFQSALIDFARWYRAQYFPAV